VLSLHQILCADTLRSRYLSKHNVKLKTMINHMKYDSTKILIPTTRNPSVYVQNNGTAHIETFGTDGGIVSFNKMTALPLWASVMAQCIVVRLILPLLRQVASYS
jgi:hypothetical protein